MTNKLGNPALDTLAAAFSDELVLAQTLITRIEGGFELRHAEDREVPADNLRTVHVVDLRGLAQRTAAGAFRPLKSSPNLQRGWRATVNGNAQLDAALRDLYPGAVADWFAAQSSPAPVTDYRPFAERQTGMYRITAMLSDIEASLVARACCPKQFCLKQRLWTIPGLPVDSDESKSIIPCLEPCAVFMELARTAVRLEQAEKATISTEDLQASVASIQTAIEHPDPAVREADFSSPRNPRRAQLVLEKISAARKGSGTSG